MNAINARSRFWVWISIHVVEDMVGVNHGVREGEGGQLLMSSAQSSSPSVVTSAEVLLHELQLWEYVLH